MTLGEAIDRAFKERNARMAGAITDRLWLAHGLTYNAQMQIVEGRGIDRRDWDELLREADEQ